MSLTATRPAPTTTTNQRRSTGNELLALGREIAARQHRLVHLSARFDEEMEWYRLGCKSASHWIADQLQIQSSTAREWIRVGHSLRYLPLVDAAFGAQDISYAKVRVLTRWADEDNEDRLLELARERSANRLTAAIARVLAEEGETDEERDVRLHEERSLTTWTDGDGMTIIRVALPPSVAKPVVAAVNELVRRIAQTPADPVEDASADTFDQQSVVEDLTVSGQDPPAGASGEPASSERSPMAASNDLQRTLRELRQRWQPADQDDWTIPSMARQRSDAFLALFLGLSVELTTEVVVHVRGDGTTFDDGTPTTNHAVLRQLDQSFMRLLIHDAERRPVNASSRRRHPTTRQKRVVMETHGHECVDCQSPELLELDHNPPYRQTLRTVTDELEPRCAPCHRARHRLDDGRADLLRREVVVDTPTGQIING